MQSAEENGHAKGVGARRSNTGKKMKRQCFVPPYKIKTKCEARGIMQ
jgi:hypothetical protein